MPAKILGCGNIPAPFRYAYFDLVAIGAAPQSRPGNDALHLSFHTRVMGSTAVTQALESLEVAWRADAAEGAFQPLKLDGKTKGKALHAVEFDVDVEDGKMKLVKL